MAQKGKISSEDFNTMQKQLQDIGKNAGELDIVREKYHLLE
jgi:hypothetical protein